MISLSGRDILHAWGKFVFTGVGLGLLIGVTPAGPGAMPTTMARTSLLPLRTCVVR